MRKNNSKLNFMKNRQASWFSHGRLKISKCSNSLAWLGECWKSKVTPLLCAICLVSLFFAFAFGLVFRKRRPCRLGQEAAYWFQWQEKWACLSSPIIFDKSIFVEIDGAFSFFSFGLALYPLLIFQTALHRVFFTGAMGVVPETSQKFAHSPPLWKIPQ